MLGMGKSQRRIKKFTDTVIQWKESRLWRQKDLDVHSGSATSCVALDKSLGLCEPHVLICNYCNKLPSSCCTRITDGVCEMFSTAEVVLQYLAEVGNV